MRKLMVALVIAGMCGCRVPAPKDMSAAEAEELQDDINGAIGLLVCGAIIGLVTVAYDHDRTPAAPPVEVERLKLQLDTDRGHARAAARAKPAKPGKAPARPKPLPAWF